VDEICRLVPVWGRFRATEWLFGGDDIWEEPLQHTGVGAILRRSMREIARRIAASPGELAALEWRDLERILFEVFDTLGYKACLTRPAKDGAYDLRLEAEGRIYFVEVKHWSQPEQSRRGYYRSLHTDCRRQRRRGPTDFDFRIHR
jgi:hypothetical protein